MLAVLKRELKNYYTSLFAYIYYGLFFLVLGIFFVLNCLTTYSTQFGYYVLSKGFLVIVAVLPFCTMSLFAMERRSKTDQLLFTAPVSSFSILVGKYLATVIFTMLPLVLSVVYPIVIAGCGEMSIRFLMGSYIASVLVTLVFLSIGMFVSTLTTNAVLAAVIFYVIYIVILLGRVIESFVGSGDIYQFFHDISVYNKYYDMISGIVRSGDVIYLILLAVGFFLLTWIVLESRRQSVRKMIVCGFVVVGLMCIVSAIGFSLTKVYDYTAERLLTFSNQTKEIVAGIDKPTVIYYMGEQSNANATYQELLNSYKQMNNNIKVEYVNVANDIELRQNYLQNVGVINTASLLVVCGERSIYLDSDDYIVTSQISTYSYKTVLKIEEQLTQALYYVNQENTDKICVLSGHEEEELNSDFSNLLLLNNFELKDIDLPSKMAGIDEVFPENCKAVILNAPQVDFKEEEINVLADYVKEGGRLFVIIDPLNEEMDVLFAFLKKYGLDIQSGVVIEREAGMYAYDTNYYLIPTIQKTQYTDSILDKDLKILTMTSKGIIKNGKANGYTCTDILTTSGLAFSKVGDFDNIATKGENDIGGPFSVASCAENDKEGSVFLLTSNVFFNEQADTESNGANRQFFIEIMKKLTGTESAIWIEGKDVGSQVALYSMNGRGVVKIMVIVIIPSCIVLLGIVVVMVRYKNIRFHKKREKNVTK